MISFEEIDSVLKHKSIFELCKDYDIRQLNDRNRNNERAEIVLNQLFPFYPVPFYVDITDFFIQTLAYNIEDNPMKKPLIKSTLERFNYGFSYELYFAMRMIDFYLTRDINMAGLQTYYNALFTINPFKEKDKKYFIPFTNGTTCEVAEAMTLLGMYFTPNERRSHCHKMTNTALLNNSSLMGAYYYIPYPFAGYIEHSVLIDPEKKVVYDLANNVAMPLDVWQKYYNNPSFLISGEEFQEINSKVIEKYGDSIGMSTIEEVRRKLAR